MRNWQKNNKVPKYSLSDWKGRWWRDDRGGGGGGSSAFVVCFLAPIHVSELSASMHLDAFVRACVYTPYLILRPCERTWALVKASEACAWMNQYKKKRQRERELCFWHYNDNRVFTHVIFQHVQGTFSCVRVCVCVLALELWECVYQQQQHRGPSPGPRGPGR